MGFDLENFGVGLAVGWGSAYVVYRLRKQISGAVQVVQKSADTAKTSATRTADSRFVNDLVDLAEHEHLAGEYVDLSQIVVEPRFVPASEFALETEEDLGNVLRVIPQIHDHPYLHASYNIDTLSINELSAGDKRVAILGAPGSGRTTALMSILLQSLAGKRFKPPFDVVQERLDKEEASMNEKQRAVRVKERVLMEQRARERLATEKGIAWNQEVDEELKNALPLFNQLMPIYVHMGNLKLYDQAGEFGAEVDPAEPIVRAVQYTVRRVTASTIPRYLYKRLNEGKVLMLIDGYDELPESERPVALAWLKALMDQYQDNFYIVTGPVSGYGGLTSLGFSPVFIRPWTDLDIRTAATYWAKSWGNFGKRRRGKSTEMDKAIIDRARANARALNPFEITIKLWANYADDVQKPGFDGWMSAFIQRDLDLDMPIEELLPILSRLSILQLEEGFITIPRLQQLAISGEAFGIKQTGEAEAAQTQDSEAGDAKEGKEKEEDVETTSVQGRMLGLLRRTGILVRYRGDRYQFRHPLLASYLASLSIKDMPREIVRQKSAHPAWKEAFAYAAGHTNLDMIVRERLTTPPDLLHNHVFEIARWAAFAPPDAAWRGAIFKLLNDLIIAPAQYPLIRERAAAALLDTRDMKNVAYTFRRAVRNLNPQIRRLAALGMGATGESDTARDLIPLLQDQNQEVRVCAAVALGSLATEEALEAIVLAFTENSEPVRQAIAEQLALLPEEGHPVLFEAVTDQQDMAMRRASIFGLRRTGTVWGLIAIYRAFLEDEQWYVRSAAQHAFEELQFGRMKAHTRRYPAVDQIQWLQEWAAAQGETLPAGEGAKDMLLRALQEGDTGVRLLAAQNIGKLGYPLMLKSLYSALRDRQESVRAMAHMSLADVQLQLGKPLPAPTT